MTRQSIFVFDVRGVLEVDPRFSFFFGRQERLPTLVAVSLKKEGAGSPPLLSSPGGRLKNGRLGRHDLTSFPFPF